MSSADSRKEKTTPAAPPIIIKKVIAAHEHAHHGGAWKVAYADFVTAMMAFFLLLWIVGATNEDQRKGIADYFAPTLIQHTKSGGSNGVMAGRSLLVPDGNAPNASPSGSQRITPIMALAKPSAAETAARERLKAEDNKKFEEAARLVDQKIMQRQELSALRNQVQFTLTEDGLRIDLVDEAAFSMFALSTNRLVPKAVSLLEEVSASVKQLPNNISIRGHTDSLPYPAPANMNNWLLSTQRAESTRQTLERNGIIPQRFSRLEGVADRELFNQANPADPKNRRISITLLYRQPKQIFKN
jgi:chemotaxis protein MotB